MIIVHLLTATINFAAVEISISMELPGKIIILTAPSGAGVQECPELSSG